MSTKVDETGNNDKGAKDEKVTIGELKKFITDSVQAAVTALGKPSETETKKTETTGKDIPADVAAQVQQELRKLQEREARKAKEAKIDETLADLTQKIQGKAPVEKRWVHNFMGWGEK